MSFQESESPLDPATKPKESPPDVDPDRPLDPPEDIEQVDPDRPLDPPGDPGIEQPGFPKPAGPS
jgi:hypothetical protein